MILKKFRSAGEGRITEGRSIPCVRKDGSVLLADVRGSTTVVDGVVCNIAFFTDVTALVAATSSLAAEFRERAQVAVALAQLQSGGSVEETAAGICQGLFSLPGIDLAAIISFASPRQAVPLAVAGPHGLPLAPGRPLPAARARYLYQRATLGPWAEDWWVRPEDGRYGQRMASLGVRAVAYAPIREGASLLGVVAAGTFDSAYATHLIDHLPAVGEFAATAGALLSGQLHEGRRDGLVRERVRRALAKGGLRPVFQPIVNLASGEPVGYEALTRFADGTPPNQMIADAHVVDLGLDLEVACLRAALDASEALPPHAWLSVNASPEVILHSTELPALLGGQTRRIVLEITEHAVIGDYAAVRAAVAGFGPTVCLAVDDAGAGFASLHHVVELEPSYLKLDIGLVRGVERNPTRQAMVAGLRHFAARSDCSVIAEGIEEPAELEMLRELGVPLGQGYLLGRPEPLPAAVGSTRRPGPARTAHQSVGDTAGDSVASIPRRGASRGPKVGERKRARGPNLPGPAVKHGTAPLRRSTLRRPTT